MLLSTKFDAKSYFYNWQNVVMLLWHLFYIKSYFLYENKLHDNIFDKVCYEKLKYKLNYSKI